MKILGKRLAALRKHLGLTQEIVARKLNINPSILSNLEQGNGGTIDTLIKLHDFYSHIFVMDKILADDFELRESNTITDTEQLRSIVFEKIDHVLGSVKNDLVELIETTLQNNP